MARVEDGIIVVRDVPGARSYETNRDVTWICKAFRWMEVQDEVFEARVLTLEGWHAETGWRVSTLGAGAGGVVRVIGKNHLDVNPPCMVSADSTPAQPLLQTGQKAGYLFFRPFYDIVYREFLRRKDRKLNFHPDLFEHRSGRVLADW